MCCLQKLELHLEIGGDVYDYLFNNNFIHNDNYKLSLNKHNFMFIS